MFDLCVCIKRVTLCNYLCFCCSCCCYFLPAVWDFGIVNRYSWFWKFLNMADQGSEFSFFWSTHVRIDIRIDISISIRPVTTKVDKQVHLEELTQITLIEQFLVIMLWLVTSLRHYRMPMATKLGRKVTYLEGFLPIMLLAPLVTCSCEI